jgi:hypothetical protein
MSRYDAIAWWSGGITSAVACKLALDHFEKVKLIFIETWSHHEDTDRFKTDCETWYNREIEVWDNKKYDDHFDVLLTERFINGPGGARCTLELKKTVRNVVQMYYLCKYQIFGFDYTLTELKRARRLKQDNPTINPLFPLLKKHITKNNAAGIIENAGIELPAMYKLGYGHNNCIGCVKGGKGYWNKIRVDFPDVFNRMVEVESEIGRSCINGTFLKDLNPVDGRGESPVIPECGVFCIKE